MKGKGIPRRNDGTHTDMCTFAGPEAGLPLGQNSSFLAAVTQAKVAPSSVWGLDAGDRSLSPRDGNLVVGGYDTSKFAGNLTTFPIGNWTQQPCPLQVTVAEVSYITSSGATPISLFNSNTSTMIACVEPFQQRFTFLPSMVNQFIGLTGYNASYSGLTFPANMRPNGSLEIRLDNGYRTVVPNDHLVTPKRGSDNNGHYVVTNSSVVETGIAYNVDDNDSDTQPILGGLFLTFNYLVVDYDNNLFQMAPMVQRPQNSDANITAVCTPSPTIAGPEASSSPTNTSHATGSSRAAAIGGGIGGAVAGLAAIAGLCYCLVRKRRRNRQQQDKKEAEQTFAHTTMGERTFSDGPSELASVSQPFYPITLYAR